MLTDPVAYGGRGEDAFEVNAPSIPGFGFSEAPHRTSASKVISISISNSFVLTIDYLGIVLKQLLLY